MKPATHDIDCLAVGLRPLPDRRAEAVPACAHLAHLVHVAHVGSRATGQSVAGTFIRPWLWLVLALGHGPGAGQNLHYHEPGAMSCPSVPERRDARPKNVALGTPVQGRVHVGCGFAEGSYTVTLGATDPGAVFAPRAFLVNFGRIVGDGAYVVTFSVAGTHSVTAGITPNMGSPAVPGRFVGPDTVVDVVGR